jgi:glycosyltransferase involved in cell wall biosynthesis
MHLAVVSPFPPAITGIGQYGYHVTRAIAQTASFDRITVLAGAREHQNSRSGITEIDYCWEPGQFLTPHIISSRIRQIEPDLVWFNLGASIFGRSPLSNLLGMLTPFITRRMGYPTVVTLHELVELADLRALNVPGGIFAPLGARILTKLATQADVLCLTMHHYAERLSARGLDCVHIPIGAYNEPELLEENSAPELLFFTTLAPFKGLELLLDAFESLKPEFPRLRLTIAGAEHARFPGYGRDLKARFNGTKNIYWRGHVAEENVKDLFRQAQVVVLPYTASTGSSSVLYQAATWGRAVVVSDLAENRELARENDLQIQFFQSGNRESLQASIRALLNSPALRLEQAGHNLGSIRRIRPTVTCDQYIHAFNRALARHKITGLVPLKSKEMKSL